MGGSQTRIRECLAICGVLLSVVDLQMSRVAALYDVVWGPEEMTREAGEVEWPHASGLTVDES